MARRWRWRVWSERCCLPAAATISWTLQLLLLRLWWVYMALMEMTCFKVVLVMITAPRVMAGIQPMEYTIIELVDSTAVMATTPWMGVQGMINFMATRATTSFKARIMAAAKLILWLAVPEPIALSSATAVAASMSSVGRTAREKQIMPLLKTSILVKIRFS